MTPLLYYSPGAISLAAHIVQEEIGQPYSLALISTSDGSTRSEEYLRLNPKGCVSALVTGSSVLTEAPAPLGLESPIAAQWFVATCALLFFSQR